MRQFYKNINVYFKCKFLDGSRSQRVYTDQTDGSRLLQKEQNGCLSQYAWKIKTISMIILHTINHIRHLICFLWSIEKQHGNIYFIHYAGWNAVLWNLLCIRYSLFVSLILPVSFCRFCGMAEMAKTCSMTEHKHNHQQNKHGKSCKDRPVYVKHFRLQITFPFV